MEASKSWAAFVSSSDEETFSVIYRTHGTMVWRICHRILGSGEEVDDAFQGTWIRLLVAARDQQSELSRTTADLVLARLATLEANRVRQKRNRLHQREVTMDPLPEPNAETIDGGNAASREELAAMVKAAMAVQPEIYRSALELHYLDGLTHQQVATVLQLPLGTVATRLRTGRARLMAALKRMGIANGGAALIVAGAMALQVTLPAAEAVYTEASAASATLPPATVDFSTISSKTAVPLLTTKAAGIATLCLIPLAIVMAIYFQPPSRLDSLTNVGSSKAEEVAPVEPLQEQSVETPQATELTPTPTATPAAVAVETEGLLTVEGVVYTDRREIVMDAKISIYSGTVGGDKATFEWHPLATTSTDRDGIYSVNLNDPLVFMVVAEADGFATEVLTNQINNYYRLENFQQKRTERVNIILTEGHETLASVKDEEGEPIAGASLRLLHPLSNSTMFHQQIFSSNDLGIASMGRLASKPYELWVTAEGFESQHIPLVPNGRELSITMKTGFATLGGFVRHASSGEPIAGAIVSAALQSTLDKDPQGSSNMLPYIQDTTGTDGSYELTLSPGNYTIGAGTVDLKVLMKRGSEQNEIITLLHDDRILDHNIDLGSNTYVVQGVILDDVTETPLPGVNVSISPGYKRIFNLMDVPETQSDSEGHFELEFNGGVIMAEFLLLKKDGYKKEAISTLQLQNSSDPDKVVYTTEVRMKSTMSRDLLLVDKENNPIAGAIITAKASPLPSTNSSTIIRAGTDENGIASFTFPEGSFSLLLHIQHPEGFTFVNSGLSDQHLLANDPTKIIVPEQTHTSFLVVDTDQNPISRSEIRLLHQSYSSLDSFSGTTNNEGRLDIQKIVPDAYIVVTSAPGFATKQDFKVIAIDDDPEKPTTIVLESARTIKGRAVDSSGIPIAGIEVSIVRDWIGSNHAKFDIPPKQVTDSEGLFSFMNIPFPSGSLTFNHGQQKQTFTAKFGDEIHDYPIDLDSFILFVGVVVDGATGEALEDYKTSISLVRRSDIDPQLMRQSTAQMKRLPNGTFTYEINPLINSGVTVTVEAPGYAIMESPAFPVEAKKEIGHIFELSSGITVSGRVVSEAGEPLRNAKVVLLPSSSANLKWELSVILSGDHHRFKPVITDSKGRFTFEQVAPGEARIVAEPTGNYRQGELMVTVFDGQDSQDVGDLVVRDGDVLKGVVLQLPDRRPIPNTYIRASVMVDMRSPWEGSLTQTDHQGEFALEGLSKGKTTISVSYNGSNHRNTKEANEWGFAEFLIGTETIRGKATLDGAPHQVWVSAKANGRHDVTTNSGTNGEFTLSGLQTGSYTITARSQQNQWERSTTVTIPTSESILIDIVTQQLHGRLLDSDGNPVEGVKMSVINLRNDEPTYATNQSWAITKADGSFTLEGAGPGRHKIRTYYKGASHDLTEFEISLGIDKDLGDVFLP